MTPDALINPRFWIHSNSKRAVPEDYYQIPAENKKGAVLEVNVEFDTLDLGRGVPRTIELGTAKPCTGVEVDLVHERKPAAGVLKGGIIEPLAQ